VSGRPHGAVHPCGPPPQYGAQGGPQEPSHGGCFDRFDKLTAGKLSTGGAEGQHRHERPIVTNAQGPAEAQADGVRMRQHRLGEQIEADRYAKAAEGIAGNTKSMGLWFARIKPPGAI